MSKRFSVAMNNRIGILALIACGLLFIILTTLGLVDEMLRTDIPVIQKAFGAWISMVAVSIIPFVAGLHFLIPLTHRYPNRT